MQEGQEQCEGEDPIRTQGQHTTRHSRHSTGPPRKKKGDTTHKTGRPATPPPFTHHATHHHDGTPPSMMAPPSTTTRGEQTEDTPPHEHHRHTHHPHTTHPAENSARHDSSTRQHCNGMSRARATPLHWAGQQQHTPPTFHTPRRMDTIHSSTHLLSLIHVHTTNDQR